MSPDEFVEKISSADLSQGRVVGGETDGDESGADDDGDTDETDDGGETGEEKDDEAPVGYDALGKSESLARVQGFVPRCRSKERPYVFNFIGVAFFLHDHRAINAREVWRSILPELRNKDSNGDFRELTIDCFPEAVRPSARRWARKFGRRPLQYKPRGIVTRVKLSYSLVRGACVCCLLHFLNMVVVRIGGWRTDTYPGAACVAFFCPVYYKYREQILIALLDFVAASCFLVS